MLTSKQRAQLRGLAATEDTIVHIGKGGITCDRLAEVCRAEPVQVIGSKFVLYKRNEQKPKIELVKKACK